MTLNGKYATQKTIGGVRLYEVDENGKLHAVATFADGPLGAALVAAITSTVAQAGGTLTDRDTGKVMAGDFSLMVAA